MTSRVAPETGTGAVSAATRVWQLGLVALDRHDERSTSTDAMRKPAPGVPVTIGFTGTVRFSRFV